MIKFFKNLISPDKWLIVEEGWNKNLQSTRESQFTLGNGYIGSRAVLEEVPYDSYPGTYIAGVFDERITQIPEIVNLPNPFNFKIMSEGEKLDVGCIDILKHIRVLDMKTGTLFRETIYQDRFKRRIHYHSMRFLSMDSKGLGVLKVFVSPYDERSLEVQTVIDTSVTNKGVINEGKKKHFNIYEAGTLKNISYLCVNTFQPKSLIAYASALEVEKGGKKYFEKDETFTLKLKKGETVSFTKIFYINCCRENGKKIHTGNGGKIKKETSLELSKCIKSGFNKCWQKHALKWRKIWQASNIDITGDNEPDKALRFNIYHLIISAGEEDLDASIGARTLSGEGYRGHVFWDTEIFMLPFFIFTNPKAAKNILMYRSRRIKEAKLIAKIKGYEGALFPWESANSGFDVTPTWAKDLDGSIIKITTDKFEQHISADIAYAVYYYYNITHDVDFLFNYAMEAIFETARFWASKVQYNKKTDTYHIKNVTGADEFHEDVDDNAYTNGMAKWNLLRAAELYRRLKKEHPEKLRAVIHRHSLNVTLKEVKKWNYIASRIALITSKRSKVIEQFKGYFKKKYIRITEFDNNFMPQIPKSVAVKDLSKTQFIKQADVVMLLYLLSSAFGMKTKKANYYFYIKRTLHKSSLSPSIHAAFGAEIGDTEQAYRYFISTVYTDLRDIHGNTNEGVHAASLGGCWQAVVNGFGGLHIKKGILCLEPRLPSHWKELKYAFFFRGFFIQLIIYGSKGIKISVNGRRGKLSFKLFGKKFEMFSQKTKILKF